MTSQKNESKVRSIRSSDENASESLLDFSELAKHAAETITPVLEGSPSKPAMRVGSLESLRSNGKSGLKVTKENTENVPAGSNVAAFRRT